MYLCLTVTAVRSDSARRPGHDGAYPLNGGGEQRPVGGVAQVEAVVDDDAVVVVDDLGEVAELDGLAHAAVALTALEPAGVTWTYGGSASLTPALAPATSDGGEVESAIDPDDLVRRLVQALAELPADWEPSQRAASP